MNAAIELSNYKFDQNDSREDANGNMISRLELEVTLKSYDTSTKRFVRFLEDFEDFFKVERYGLNTQVEIVSYKFVQNISSEDVEERIKSKVVFELDLISHDASIDRFLEYFKEVFLWRQNGGHSFEIAEPSKFGHIHFLSLIK